MLDRLTSEPERPNHDQGDQNVDAEADSHFYVDPTELLLVFSNSFDILVPILVWLGQTIEKPSKIENWEERNDF